MELLLIDISWIYRELSKVLGSYSDIGYQLQPPSCNGGVQAQQLTSAKPKTPQSFTSTTSNQAPNSTSPAFMFARTTVHLHFSSAIVSRTFLRQYTTKKPFKMASKDLSAAAAKAHDFIDFVNDSPTRMLTSSLPSSS